MKFGLSHLLHFLLFFLFFVYVFQASDVLGYKAATGCPHDVRLATQQCLSLYDLQLDSLRAEGHAKFMTGADVEVIRSICSSLSTSFVCVRNLRDQCPPESRDAIEEVVAPQTTVVRMCRFPELFEVYAMNQRCFRINARESRQCYEVFLRHTKQPMRDEDFEPIGASGLSYVDHFCSNFRKLSSCVGSTVEKCNSRLANVTHALIQATVPHSRFCKDHHRQQPHNINNNHHNNNNHQQHQQQQQSHSHPSQAEDQNYGGTSNSRPVTPASQLILLLVALLSSAAVVVACR